MKSKGINRRKGEEGIVLELVTILKASEDTHKDLIKQNAAKALANALAGPSGEENKKRVLDAGGIEALVGVLKAPGDTHSDDTKQHAASALGNATAGTLGSENRRRAGECGGIEALVEMLKVPEETHSDFTKLEVGKALRNCCTLADNMARAEAAGVFQATVHLLRNRYDQPSTRDLFGALAGMIETFCVNPLKLQHFVDAGLTGTLLQLSRNDHHRKLKTLTVMLLCDDGSDEVADMVTPTFVLEYIRLLRSALKKSPEKCSFKCSDGTTEEVSFSPTGGLMVPMLLLHNLAAASSNAPHIRDVLAECGAASLMVAIVDANDDKLFDDWRWRRLASAVLVHLMTGVTATTHSDDTIRNQLDACDTLSTLRRVQRHIGDECIDSGEHTDISRSIRYADLKDERTLELYSTARLIATLVTLLGDDADGDSSMSKLMKDSTPAVQNMRADSDGVPPVEDSAITGNEGGHIMVSYDPGSLDTVRKIVRSLNAAGLTVWVDYEKIQVSDFNTANVKIGQAIEQSRAVLICMSQQYQSSVLCKMECEYARRCHHHHRVAYLTMQKVMVYQPSSWLEYVLETAAWRDLSDEAAFDKHMPRLCSQLTEGRPTDGRIVATQTAVGATAASATPVSPSPRTRIRRRSNYGPTSSRRSSSIEWADDGGAVESVPTVLEYELKIERTRLDAERARLEAENARAERIEADVERIEAEIELEKARAVAERERQKTLSLELQLRSVSVAGSSQSTN
eukprot:GFYU01020986.1.p1 GENE.GFYU01020986.1~~GFYU01020986.1.p1  ORF type:complete len:742 (-),score=119.97 GFYU01020986.1:557-2782(-)